MTEQTELTRERGTGAGRGSPGNAGRKEKRKNLPAFP